MGQRIDIMTDIETLGHKSYSTIIQIAAMAFDISTGEELARFNRIADITKNEEMSVTGSTLSWWLNTDKELLTSLINQGKGSSEEVLREFHQWINELDPYGDQALLWGNGILFDNKMIQHQLENIGLRYPIKYNRDRDMRTIVELAADHLNVSVNSVKDMFRDSSLTAHDAMDDVINQVAIVRSCYQMLVNR